MRERCVGLGVCVLCCVVLPQAAQRAEGGLRGAKKHTIYRERQKFKALERIKHAE